VCSISVVSLLSVGGFLARPAAAAERPAAPRAGSYSAWEFQADKKRYWCRYSYTNGMGRTSYQFVLYYPEEDRNKVYYFQTPGGRIWACCTRPGAAGYNAQSMKWYRLDNSGKWVRRADGDCPTPPDGGPRIADQGDARPPVTPPPAEFAQLSAAERQAAERFHQLLGEVTIEDSHITGLDFGGSDLQDAALPDVGKIATLERLYLNGTQISDAGLARLAALKGLTHLDVSQTQVTDAGLKQLERLPALRTLIVRGSHNISADGVRTARKNNPRLLITGP
jgi:hypothetical protein